MTIEESEAKTPPARVERVRAGKRLGGVCAGLPEIWGLGTNGLRLAFVVAALCGGIGVVVYLACWLVIPLADTAPEAEGASGAVLLAWGMGGLVVVALLAAIGALATVFGLGWVVIVLAALLLAATLSGHKRLPSLVGLLGVAALTLPAVAVALSPIRLAVQSGASMAAPKSAKALTKITYRSGLGTLLIDLRHTELPTSGTVPLKIDAGLRRTIVALPTDTCVHVRVNYNVHTFTSQLATLISGRSTPPFADVVLFGRLYGGNVQTHPQGVATSQGTKRGPTLDINFSSQGSGLFVRDYPNNVDPDTKPNWPGFVVHLEPPPNLRYEPRAARKQIVRDWHRRRRAQRASQRLINKLLPGPCVR